MSVAPHSPPASPAAAPTALRRARPPCDPGGALPPVGSRLGGAGAWVEVYAHSALPTRTGAFSLLIFRSSVDAGEQVALVRGSVRGPTPVPCRLHSECLTGDVLGSLRCDCRQQLEMTLQALGQQPSGVLLYLRQEGRGIGLGNKVRAYALQEAGLDTFAANRHLGFDADLRDYRVAALMLRLLGVEAVRLATNNPHKIHGLRAHGIEVAGRQPLVAAANPYNAAYLRAKAVQHGHMLAP